MFIAFEGIDGSGKTTIAKIVTDMLVEIGVPADDLYDAVSKVLNTLKAEIEEVIDG